MTSYLKSHNMLNMLFVFCVCLSYSIVRSLQPCGHLQGKGRPLGSLVCDVFLCFVTFPDGVLGQVWYLIVSIPDLCLLSYFCNEPHSAVSNMSDYRCVSDCRSRAREFNASLVPYFCENFS